MADVVYWQHVMVLYFHCLMTVQLNSDRFTFFYSLLHKTHISFNFAKLVTERIKDINIRNILTSSFLIFTRISLISDFGNWNSWVVFCVKNMSVLFWLSDILCLSFSWIGKRLFNGISSSFETWDTQPIRMSFVRVLFFHLFLFYCYI